MNRCALFLWTAIALAQGSPDIVVSQVYGGGGNAGAPLRNDFIELFNRSKTAVSVSGWSLQYSSAAGADWQVTPLQGTIEPGRYHLIQQAAGANAAAPALPDPDVTGVIPMSGTAAKVALLRTTTPLTGATPSTVDLVDLVGYGNVSASEKAPAPALTNTTAALRRGNGCVDTDDNSADFQTAAPRPRNSLSDASPGCDAATPEPATLKISEIQGPGAESPVTGRFVSTRGIVTGRKTNGFFLQSTMEDQDEDPRTSEGIFVFTSTAPPASAAVGNLVEVIATVAEFRPAADLGSPPVTELVDPIVQFVSSGQNMPPPLALPPGDLENLEGMRVTVASLRVVAPTGGSVSESNATATSNGVFYGVQAGEVRPFTSASGTLGGQLLRVDSRALGRPATLDARTGDVTGSLSGPLDFAFRTYTIAAESAVLFFSTPPSTTFIPRGTGEFAVASMNLQRLFDTEDDPRTSDPVLTSDAFQRRIARISRTIRETLGSPEIIGVEEVESLPVLQALARAIGDYEGYLLEGNDIGGIDVGVLVRKDRVTVQSFAQEGKDTRLDTGDILNDRPPVVLRATVLGLPVVVVVNHLRSLINADSPVVARKRQTQSEFLGALLGRESHENLISLGDYNMDQYDPLMRIILAPGLLNLNDTLRPNEAYSYVFDGVTQALDHVIVSPSALRYLARYQVAHINADFPESTRNDATSNNRISDHDVPVAYFALELPTLRAASVTNSANYVGGSIAPNEWVTIFAPGPVTRVVAGGLPAQVVYSTVQQTNVILPSTLPTGVRPFLFGANEVSLVAAAAAPGIFTVSGTGKGQGAILNQDLTMNGEERAAERGAIIAIYGTGINGNNTRVWIGNSQAQVTYSGPAPGLPTGINQVNARIPREAPTGAEVPVLIASGDEVSAAGVTVAIR